MGFISHLFGANNDYQAKGATNLVNPLSDPNSIAALNNLKGVNDNQNNLVAALTAAMNGQGPSLADAQFQKNLAQNVGAGNAQIAGQKGINQGLINREILTNENAANGNAANDAATLKANEQLAARQQLGQTLNQEGTQNLNQLGTVGGLTTGFNNTNVTNANGSQGTNAQIAAQNAGTNAGIGGSILNSAGAASGKLLGFSAGGEVLDWGDRGKKSGEEFGKGLTSFITNSPKSGSNVTGGGGTDATGGESLSGDDTSGPSSFNPIAGLTSGGSGSGVGALRLLESRGGRVPGKAAINGDSYSNDTVPAMLSPGEIVVPRSIAQSPDAADKAADFIAALKAEKEKKSGKEMRGYAHVLASHQNLKDRLSEIEKLCYGGMAG